MKKIILTLVILILLTGIFYFFSGRKYSAPTENKKNLENNNPAIEESSLPVANENHQAVPDKIDNLEPKIPAKILMDVPFTSQAPYAKWDVYHEEACEEASLIMVKYFLDKKKLTPQIAEDEIQKMIKFEIKNYGDYQDSNAQQIEKLAKDFYGIDNLKVIYDFSQENIKKYLAQGRPIIVPAAGRLLGNPNYTPPGPLYHNLVLIGYDGNTIITNDAGTKKGAGYEYKLENLYNAIHDFPGRPEDILKGRKAMLVLE